MPKPLDIDKFVIRFFDVWSTSPFDDVEIDRDDFHELLLECGILEDRTFTSEDIAELKEAGTYTDQQIGETIWAPTKEFMVWYKAIVGTKSNDWKD